MMEQDYISIQKGSGYVYACSNMLYQRVKTKGNGATENAGLENSGPSKMQGWKTRDWKTRDRLKGGGKRGTKMQGWKMQDWKHGTIIPGVENATSSYGKPKLQVYLVITNA